MSDVEQNENSELAELDQLLDGELPEARAEACALRIAADGAVTEVLEKLRAHREVRTQVWDQCLPSAEAADLFSDRAIKAARRHAWQMRWNRTLRISGAAAACILVGFVTGWSGRGHTSPVGSTAIQRVEPSPGVPAMTVADNGNTGAYYVELTDASGHPVAMQRFDKLQDAQAFARDLNHVRSNSPAVETAMPLAPQQPPAQRPLVVPVSDEY